MRKRALRLASILLVICLLLSGCGMSVPKTSSVSEEQQPSNTPLLWRVQTSAGGCVYLFGSIHVGEESLYPLPDYVTEAFADCDALAVECDIIAYENDPALMQEMAEEMIYTDGTTIQSYMDEELYEQAKEVLTEYGLYMQVYDLYKPGMWNSLVSTAVTEASGLKTEYGVDRHFLQEAKDRNMEILEIESVEEQMELLNGFSDEFNFYMIRSTVENVQIQAAQQNVLYSAWESGNERLLEQMCVITDEQIAMGGTLAPELEIYRDKMYTRRNTVMAQAAAKYLEQGQRVFLTVGAAHMMGETGIVQQLTDMGYTVEQIEPSGQLQKAA